MVRVLRSASCRVLSRAMMVGGAILACVPALAASVEKPVFSPSSGELRDRSRVTVTCPTRDVVIRMVSGGSEPSTSSPIVSGAVEISSVHARDGKVVLKARAYLKDGKGQSDVATATYTFKADTVATPVFSPSSGSLKEGDQVSVSCSTRDVTIRMEARGAEPTTSSPVVSGAVKIEGVHAKDGKVTLKARAYRNDKSGASALATAVYTWASETVAKPFFSIRSGTVVKSGTRVELECETKAVTIHYVFGGNEPGSASLKADGPLELSEKVAREGKIVLKARAVRNDGRAQSEVATATYVLEGEPVKAPMFSIVSGTSVRSGAPVTVSCPTKDVTIRLAIGGAEPTASSSVVSAPIELSERHSRDGRIVLKARAYRNDGSSQSPVATAEYLLVQETLAPPTIAPSGGVYTEKVRVEIRSSVPGATVRYTTDGREPTAASRAFDGAFQVTPSRDGVTVLAKAFKAGATESRTAAATYRAAAAGPVQVVRLSPPSGTRFTGKLTVKVETGEPGGTIVVTPEGGGLPAGDFERPGSGTFEVSDSVALRARVRSRDGRLGEPVVARYVRVPAPPKLTPSSNTRFRGSIRIQIEPADGKDLVEWELDGGAFARDKKKTYGMTKFELYESATITAKSWSKDGESSSTVRIRVEKE